MDAVMFLVICTAISCEPNLKESDHEKNVFVCLCDAGAGI